MCADESTGMGEAVGEAGVDIPVGEAGIDMVDFGNSLNMSER